MEKHKPHYLLKAIQAQMTTPEAMNLTLSALAGIRSAGMAQADALAVIQDLTAVDFYKSMTVNSDHRVWQDVYHCRVAGSRAIHQVSASGRIFCDFIQGKMK